MELNNIPDIFSNKLRLAILAALVMEPKTFRDLKEITLATDGNLGGQLSKLEECGAIFINKESNFLNSSFNKPHAFVNKLDLNELLHTISAKFLLL